MNIGWLISLILVIVAIMSSTYYCFKRNCTEHNLDDDNSLTRKTASHTIVVGHRWHKLPCNHAALSLLFEPKNIIQQAFVSAESPTDTMAKSLAYLQLSAKKKMRRNNIHKTNLKFMPLLKRYGINKKIATHKKPRKKHLSLKSRKTIGKAPIRIFWKQYHTLKHRFYASPHMGTISFKTITSIVR